MSIGQVRSGYGQGTVTPQKYVHTVSVVISLFCSFINPLTYTVNSPDGLLWNNITPLYNVHVFMCVFNMFFYDFSYIFYVQNCTRSRFFITFRTFHVFKIEKLLGFGRFIWTFCRIFFYRMKKNATDYLEISLYYKVTIRTLQDIENIC